MSTAGQQSPLQRRALLRAAVAIPAAGAAVAAFEATPAQASASTSASARVGRFDPESPRFALAVLPDTQYLFDADSADPAPLRETFR